LRIDTLPAGHPGWLVGTSKQMNEGTNRPEPGVRASDTARRFIMSKTSLLITGALALSGIFVVSAKSYDITLFNPSKAGKAMLPAGEYRVKLEGSNAVFTGRKKAEQFTAPVKIENARKKHEQTAVETTNQNGTDKILAIRLAGSTETLEFSN
jgi:hypothetical protein